MAGVGPGLIFGLLFVAAWLAWQCLRAIGCVLERVPILSVPLVLGVLYAILRVPEHWR